MENRMMWLGQDLIDFVLCGKLQNLLQAFSQKPSVSHWINYPYSILYVSAHFTNKLKQFSVWVSGVVTAQKQLQM